MIFICCRYRTCRGGGSALTKNSLFCYIFCDVLNPHTHPEPKEGRFQVNADPDPLVRGTDPAPDPSIIKQKKKDNLNSYCASDFFDFLSLKNDANVDSKSNKQTNDF
jgi:hypothetical protein